MVIPRLADWFQRGQGASPRDPAPGGTLVLLDSATAVPGSFLSALEALFAPLGVVRLGGEGGASTEPRAVLQRLRRAQPERVVVLGPLPCAADVLREARGPILWISPGDDEESARLAHLVTVRSERQRRNIPAAHVTGDPLLGIETLPDPPDASLCERFQSLRSRGRWILYFSQTEEGEETAAYASFLKMLRVGAGLLALAPRDPARFEPVYRDAMRFHLTTNRHGRLLTSSVSPQTRVYYLEDPVAAREMYACADVVVSGGTLVTRGPAPEALLPLSLGRPVVVGPLTHGALLEAARADGAVCAVDHPDALDAVLAPLLTLAPERQRCGDAGKAWVELQAGSAQRVLALLSKRVSV
ncbi:MAG: hypothetical protein ACYCRH_04505 [Acidiferrobacteraceae bacterium]